MEILWGGKNMVNMIKYQPIKTTHSSQQMAMKALYCSQQDYKYRETEVHLMKIFALLHVVPLQFALSSVTGTMALLCRFF